MLVSVRFAVSTIVDDPPRSYAAGEIAGFETTVAEHLIGRGVAVRVPRSAHPVVEQAMGISDEHVRRAAEILMALPGRLEALQQQAVSLRGQLAEVDRAEAHALVHGIPASENGVRTALAEVERQRTVLVAEEERIFDDLVNAIMAYIERAASALFDEMAPTYRSLTDDMRKVGVKHARLDRLWAQVDSLHTVAASLQLDAIGPVNAAEAHLAAEIGGDATTSVTGAQRLPRALGPLLACIAAHQAREQGSR